MLISWRMHIISKDFFIIISASIISVHHSMLFNFFFKDFTMKLRFKLLYPYCLYLRMFSRDSYALSCKNTVPVKLFSFSYCLVYSHMISFMSGRAQCWIKIIIIWEVIANVLKAFETNCAFWAVFSQTPWWIPMPWFREMYLFLLLSLGESIFMDLPQKSNFLHELTLM